MSLKAAEQCIDVGDFRQAAVLLNTASADQTSKTLRAFAEIECGETAAALDLANKLLKQSLSPQNQARCLAVAGRAHAREGRVSEGLALLKKAVAISSSCSPFLEAEIRAQHVSAALNWLGVEPALAELPVLRRTCLVSANRAALVEYHIAYARIAALRGWRAKSQSELSAARALLSSFPHLAMSWRLEQSLASIAILSGELDKAIAHGERGLKLAEEIGSRSKRASALANLAYITSAAGDFDRATSLLKDSHDLLESASQIRFATLGTGINVGLRTGRSEFARTMLEDGEALKANCTSDTYYRVSFALQQVFWHVRQREFDKAIAIADEALQVVGRIADFDLADRIKLLRVEALALNGDEARASDAFQDIGRKRTQFTLEVIAEIERVSALLCYRNHPAYSSCALTIASRVLSASRFLGSLCDVDHTTRMLSPAIEDDLKSKPDALTLLNQISLILRLGRYTRVLAHEVFSLIEATGLCKSGTLSECVGDDLKEIARFGNPGQGGPQLTARSEEIRLGDDRDAFVIKVTPDSAELFAALRMSVEQVIVAATACERTSSEPESQTPWPFESIEQRDGMVVGADATSELLGTTKRIAPSNITVLITGETGTGKELFARALHDASPRRDKPFIPFNCSAVSKEMLDAQLFGYRRGAFTGATEAFPGVIRAAAGGTLFLDEIGEVALDVQPKLLRFLESGEIHPLGESRPIPVDVRVVAATNADLEHMVDEGRFREDLFYRLNVVRLHVPPLRERREEIPPLVQHYLDKCSRESHKTGLRVADETIEYLILYRWPGNVRQLANEIRRMVALAETNAVLMPEHLSADIAASRRTVPASERPLAPTEFVVRVDQPMSAAMEHLERSMIQYALRLSGGRLEDAAERLGLSRKGLYLKRQRLALLDAEADRQSTMTA